MFILKRSDLKKDLLKKKATLEGGGIFGQQLNEYLNGRAREGKRIRFLTKKNIQIVKVSLDCLSVPFTVCIWFVHL